MSVDLTTVLFSVAFLCLALLFVPSVPPLILATATLTLAILCFIQFGWAWQLLLLLLFTAIFFTFWWALRKRSP